MFTLFLFSHCFCTLMKMSLKIPLLFLCFTRVFELCLLLSLFTLARFFMQLHKCTSGELCEIYTSSQTFISLSRLGFHCLHLTGDSSCNLLCFPCASLVHSQLSLESDLSAAFLSAPSLSSILITYIKAKNKQPINTNADSLLMHPSGQCHLLTENVLRLLSVLLSAMKQLGEIE